MSKANTNKLAYVGKKPNTDLANKRDSDAWFTPPEYLESVRAVLGTVDLDPFTSARANEIVKATHIFTVDNSAFDNDWDVAPSASVFMNPPYSAGLCARSVKRFLEQLTLEKFTRGIVLVNNATDTKWFNALVESCAAICFTDHRISFWNNDRKNVSSNTRGQAFFYFGEGHQKFQNRFRKHGFVVLPAK